MSSPIPPPPLSPVPLSPSSSSKSRDQTFGGRGPSTHPASKSPQRDGPTPTRLQPNTANLSPPSAAQVHTDVEPIPYKAAESSPQAKEQQEGKKPLATTSEATPQDQAAVVMIPEQFQSKFVDLTKIDPQSLLRISQLVRGSNDRRNKAEEVLVPKSVLYPVADTVQNRKTEEVSALQSCEDVERKVIGVEAGDGFAVIHNQWKATYHVIGKAIRDAAAAKRLPITDAKRQRKLLQLEAERSVRAFWEQLETQDQLSHAKKKEEERTAQEVRKSNDAMKELRKEYERDVPGLATSLFESRERGDSARSEHQSPSRLNGLTYDQYAASQRKKYFETQHTLRSSPYGGFL